MQTSDPDRASTPAASAPDAVAEPSTVAGSVPLSGSPAEPLSGSSAEPLSGSPDVAVPGPLAAAAAELFGDRLPLAERYAHILLTDGVVRGLIGPREAPRLWDRHLLNCAALSALIPADASVVDVGSGAGLPGIVLSVARPDIRVVLVDSLVRRTDFLSEAVAALGLDRVEVVRGRAEECAGRLPLADVVTARAVAPLDRLTAWCLPLARPGGVLLALKGASAEAEVEAHRAAVRRLGGGDPEVRQCAVGLLDPPATVIEVRRLAPARSAALPGSRAGRGAGPRGGDRSRGADSPRGAGSSGRTGRSGDGRETGLGRATGLGRRGGPRDTRDRRGGSADNGRPAPG